MKKFFVFLIVILTVLSSVVTVSAVETSTSSSGAEHGGSSGKFGDDTSNINTWTWRSFDNYLHDYDLTNHVFDNLKDLSYKISNSGSCVALFDKKYMSGSSFLSHLTFYCFDSDISYKPSTLYDYACGIYSSCHNFYTYSPHIDNVSTKSCNGDLNSYLSIGYNGTYSDNYCYIVSDFDVYRSLISQFPDFSEQIFYCSDPLNSLLNYQNAGQYNFTDIKLLDGYKNLIKFYDQFDSPKGNYGINYYETPLENYINSGVMFKDDVFYQNSKLDDDQKAFQISQLVDFYIIPDKSTQQSFTNMRLFDFLDSNMSLNAVDDYLKNNSCALYYDESGILETSDWYTKHIVNGQSIVTNFATNFKLGYWKDKQQFYIKFTMPDAYSRLENADKTSVILTGCHTKHSCQAVNPKTGEEISAGFGKNINNADNAKRPSKKDLLDNGWQRGYPNTKGNYPYKMTLNVNGEEYLYVYFANMPSVSSNFFSDNCIQYGVNFYGTKGYFYDPVNNVSHEFDMTNFSTDETRDFNNKNYFGSASVKVRDPLDAVKDFLGSSSQSVTADFLGIDISEFSNTFTAYFWTNYTGSLSAGYKGYYVQFNWRLEGNEHFQKNNSDDTHNYDDDYKKDEAQKDNNGNTHGGAVEDATTGNVYGDNNFRNDDFNFDDNTLWSYANQFLAFAAKCFTVLPEWVWMLIGSSFVIIIVLRLLGR